MNGRDVQARSHSKSREFAVLDREADRSRNERKRRWWQGHQNVWPDARLKMRASWQPAGAHGRSIAGVGVGEAIQLSMNGLDDDSAAVRI